MREEKARVAAKWWADLLRKGAKLDHGDPSQTGGMIMIMGKVLQSKVSENFTLEKIQKFEDALVEKLLNPEDYSHYIRFGLHVDYNPASIFVECAEEAGIKLGMVSLPWKTNMWFRDDKITVSYGYGAPSKVIWNA
jgi:hypothetical protein